MPLEDAANSEINPAGTREGSGALEPERVDVLVVGSGFGGSVAACRLAQADFQVLILERGRRFEQRDFPALPADDALLPDTRRWTWAGSQGLWDIIDLGEVVSAQSAGYGGGSLIYANVHLRPPPEVFDDRWPLEYEGGANLGEFFDLAAYMLGAAPITESELFGDGLKKAKHLEQAMKNLKRGPTFFHPPLAVSYKDGPNAHGVQQNKCTGCGACCSGCPEKAKNTLDHNYLAVAESAGAQVRTQCEVLGFEAIQEGDYRYRVHCLDHLEARSYYVDTKYLFLSAGSVHSTRLLAGAKLEDKRLCDLVGVGYFPGGDALGMVYDTTEKQAPSFGPTITTSTVQWRHEKGSFFMLQDGGYARELSRMTGLLRAPAWMSRNRFGGPQLSKERRSGIAASLASLGGEPTVPLPSMLDDLVNAVGGGDFDKLVKPGVVDAFNAVLKELKNPLLLPWVVGGTISGGISDRYFRWFKTRFKPGAFPLGWAAAAEEWLIRGLYAGNDGLAVGALRAAFRAGGLSAHAVAAQTANYDAKGAQHRMMLLCMGRDAAAGHLIYDHKTRRVTADLNLERLAPGYVEQEQLMMDVAKELGGELRTNPAWAFLGKPITVHNQGGCPMSDKPEHGVTAPNGQVHGHEGLFVMDAAVFCSSVGVNPSATILAISERNVLSFIRSKRGADWGTVGDTGAPGAAYHRQRESAKGWRRGAAKWKLTPPLERSPKPVSLPLGIKFSETMEGYFTPNVPNPGQHDSRYRAYETKGRPAHHLKVNLDIRQEDLTSFFEDPQHQLDAKGSLFVQLPGESASGEFAVEGSLDLLAPRVKSYAISDKPESRRRLDAQRRFGRDYNAKTEHDETRFLRYALYLNARIIRDEKGIELRREPIEPGWRLEGYKRVRDQPGLGAWRDVSNLFIKLLGPNQPSIDPPGTTGTISGAGVIHVDLFAFLKDQLASVRATGADNDPLRQSWATAVFAKFFFVTLQRIYLPELNTLLGSLMRSAS